MLYYTVQQGTRTKNTEDPDKTTNRQKCLSYICIVIFQQRESLRSDPGAFLISRYMPAASCLDKYE